MTVSITFTYKTNNRFKEYSVFIGENFLDIFRGGSDDPYRSWDLEDFSLHNAKKEAATWLSSRVGSTEQQLINEWKPEIMTPYFDERWLDESWDFPAV